MTSLQKMTFVNVGRDWYSFPGDRDSTEEKFVWVLQFEYFIRNNHDQHAVSQIIKPKLLFWATQLVFA